MVAAGVYAILLTQTLNALGTMIVLPTLPFYMMDLGATAFTISLLGSAYNLAQMLFSPALGSFSDRMGRKSVMLVGLVGQALSNGLMSCAGSIPFLIVARMFVGVALSTGPVEMAYIMDFVQDERELSRVLALQRVMTSAGALAGPVLARCLEDEGFPVLCRGLVALNLLQLLLGALLWGRPPAALQEDSDGEAVKSQSAEELAASQGLLGMLTTPATGLLLFASLVYTMGCNISDGPEVVFFTNYFDFGKKEVSYFFMVTNISSLCCTVFVPPVIQKFGARAACIMGCLGYCIMVLNLIVWAGVQWIPYAFGYAVGLLGSLFGMGFMHLARQSCDPKRLGALLGLQSSLNGAAGTVAPPLGGALYDWYAFSPCMANSLLALLAALVFANVAPEKVEEKLPLVARMRPSFRRRSTFGKPIYPAKDFTTQVNLNALRIENDPDLVPIYEYYRELIDKERGTLHAVATVPGNMQQGEEKLEERRRRATSIISRHQSGL